MKTIVFLSHFDGNLYGFRLPIMRALAKSGIRVIALTPHGNFSAKFSEFNIEHIPFAIDRLSKNPFKAVVTIWRITKILRKIKPDILHCFTVKPNIFGAFAGRLAGVKIIYATVTGLGSYFISSDHKSKIVRMIILLGYKTIAPLITKMLFQNGDDLALFVRRKIIKKHKTVMIGSSGIDTALWRRQRARNNETITVLFIARLIAHKGIYELITAFRNLKTKFGDKIRFVIGGGLDGGNPSSITQATLDEWQRENIAEFAGEQTEVQKYYENADIFVLPSYREGVPRTVLEAMSKELAVVTTDTVGCRETVVDYESGLIVPPRSAEALEAALELLITDHALRRRLAANARLRAETLFDIQAVVARYLPLYGEK